MHYFATLAACREVCLSKIVSFNKKKKCYFCIKLYEINFLNSDNCLQILIKIFIKILPLGNGMKLGSSGLKCGEVLTHTDTSNISFKSCLC